MGPAPRATATRRSADGDQGDDPKHRRIGAMVSSHEDTEMPWDEVDEYYEEEDMLDPVEKEKRSSKGIDSYERLQGLSSRGKEGDYR